MGDDQIIALKAHHSRLQEANFHGLPEEIKVRFVRVHLETNKYEVLISELFTTFSTTEFKAIYHIHYNNMNLTIFQWQ